jgi:membrane-associated phospholipid phosphatase
LALLWGPVVTLSVLATGNHYVFDVAAGLLVTAAGFTAGRLTNRLRHQAANDRRTSSLAVATRSHS